MEQPLVKEQLAIENGDLELIHHDVYEKFNVFEGVHQRILVGGLNPAEKYESQLG